MIFLIIFLTLLLTASLVYLYLITHNVIIIIIAVVIVILFMIIEQLLKSRGIELNLFGSKDRGIKILDENAIIDGRIIDICKSKFISGVIAVPKFIIEYLQKLSKSDNLIERAKGRRGLDVISRLQENQTLPFKIINKDYQDVNELDKKLMKLAKELKASVITTDFNINKLGLIDNINVLNINDLSLALKHVILPGEEIHIFIMKEGKERNQGVGYLDDGTMVVVEDGYNYIGRKMDVIVQSILQTSNGRIIFTKIKR